MGASGTSRFFDYESGADSPTASVVFLRDASAEDWGVIGAHSERRRFHAGESIVRAGDTDRALIIVLDGALETVAERRGKQRRLSPAPAGSVVGEVGFLDGRPRSASVVATSNGELLRMSFASFETLSAVSPRLGQRILLSLGEILAERLRALTTVVMGS